MKTSLLILAITSFSLSVCLAQTLRKFEDNKGRVISATLLSVNDDEITLKLANGTEATIKISTLSAADQEYIKSTAAEDSDKAKGINEAIGFPAFNSSSFASRNAKEIAKILKMPLESESPVGSSWRLYAAARKPGYTLFGAVPYSAALYSAENGNASSMSLVFANKGDFNSTAGFGQDHFKKSDGAKTILSLEEAMQQDYDQIRSALTKALGEGTEQRYGETATRRTILRWDWNDHSFLLSMVDEEYVSVIIIPTEQAENDGRSAKVSDDIIRERLAKSVKIESNGDVLITNIPMVDQGPKGYCVPATFERAMRFMGMQADMYLLAMVGETNAGGGTSVRALTGNLKSQVYSKGRRLKESTEKKIAIRTVKRQIDAGIPLLWSMCSTKTYNDIANENTKSRKNDEHQSWIDEQNDLFKKKDKADDNHHMCMIIGYNEKTQELAVSDSWGKRYELRWVPINVADWANTGALVAIQP